MELFQAPTSLYLSPTTPPTFTPSKKPRFTCHDWFLGSSIGQACSLLLIFLALNLVGTLSHCLLIQGDITLFGAAWKSFSIVIDTGTVASLPHTTTDKRLLLVAVVLSCLGMLFQLTVFGAIVGNLHGVLEYLRQEKSYDALSHHTLVLGWNEKTLLLLVELQRHAVDLQQDDLVLIVASRDASVMKREILDHLEPTRSAVRFQVLCRTGSPDNPNVLYRMSVTTAKKIIVLGHDPASLDVVRTMVAIGTLPIKFSVKVCVEAQSEVHALALEALLPDHIRAIWVKPTVARVLSLGVLDPVLVSCFLQLLFDLHQVPCPPKYLGKSFQKACQFLKSGLCVGVMRPGAAGGILFAPPRDLLLRSNDSLLVLQPTDDITWIPEEPGGSAATRRWPSLSNEQPVDAMVDEVGREIGRVQRHRLARRNLRQDGGIHGRAARAVDPLMVRGTRHWTWTRPWAAGGRELRVPRRHRELSPFRRSGDAPCILVASGGNHTSVDLMALLQALDDVAPPGTQVHLLLRVTEQKDERLTSLPELRHILVQKCEGDRTSLFVRPSLDLLQFHYIVVLGEDVPAFDGSSDAECLLCSSTLAALLSQQEKSAGVRKMPQIICEVLDNQTIQMLDRYNVLNHRASFFFRHEFEAALFAYATLDWDLHTALTELLNLSSPRPLDKVPCAKYLRSEGVDSTSGEFVSVRTLADRVLEQDGHIVIGCHNGRDQPNLFAGTSDLRDGRMWDPAEELLVIKCNSEVPGWPRGGADEDDTDEDWRSEVSSIGVCDHACSWLEYIRSCRMAGRPGPCGDLGEM